MSNASTPDYPLDPKERISKLASECYLNAGESPASPPRNNADDMVRMVDAAMVEMQNMHPPMRRSECERLIKAALAGHMAAAAMVRVGYGAWQPIETLEIGGDAVLLFAEAWKDPDTNPPGIREGFKSGEDDGAFYSARWNDCHECWETAINDEPTHWMPRPLAP